MLLLVLIVSTGRENPWLASTGDHVYEAIESVFLELHTSAILCLSSGECLCPDATVCAALMSALYSSVGEEAVLNRQLMVCQSMVRLGGLSASLGCSY